MRPNGLLKDKEAADKVITYAFVALAVISLLSATGYLALRGSKNVNSMDDVNEWVDPVVEIEDENHSHTDLLAHRLQTDNMLLIDYHNLNCDGNVAPPPELDNVAGRPCFPEYKNVGPTPGDSSEIAIEGNFMEDCVKNADGTGGCYAYVSSYNQFEILDISEPNNIVLLSTYYAEVGRMIDIKVTPDNNWVLVNHELTNSDLDPIPQDDDANSGANRLDVISVVNKNEPIKVAEWNNPHQQDSTTKTCMSTATGSLQTHFGRSKNAISSSMEQIHILKWLRATLVHSTRELKFSMSLLALNHGTLWQPMKSKTIADKSSAGVATLLNQKPPVVAQFSTTTTCSTFTPSLDKSCSTSPIGMLDCESLMSQTHQKFLTQKASAGHKTTKSADGLVARALMMDGTALMVAAMPTCPQKNGAAAVAHSTATAGFTMRFLTTTCCAMEPKTLTQWKLGMQNVVQDQTMLNSASTGDT